MKNLNDVINLLEFLCVLHGPTMLYVTEFDVRLVAGEQRKNDVYMRTGELKTQGNSLISSLSLNYLVDACFRHFS